ncbi:MAG: hypothetical protein HC837_10945 [Chloroflexaceae bacterium]|nr:hypothetical protein [Chloroflexaceae bacterium]
MTVLSFDGEQRAREALRRVDVALEADVTHARAIQKQAHAFRDDFFQAFEFIENQSLQLNELIIQIQRVDANQLQIQTQGHPLFYLILDAEVAYDSKPARADQPAESPPTVELAARMLVVCAPPYRGLLRHYGIFHDGSWKRTVFGFGANGLYQQYTGVPSFNADILALEACDLLGYATTMHPTWANLLSRAETMTYDMARDRNEVKIHLTGLVTPRNQRSG